MLCSKQVIFKAIFLRICVLNTECVLTIVLFDTGENFHIKVRGSTHIVSIELEKQTVRFLDTYNTMVRQLTFKITNKSNHLLTYMCMKNDCVYYGIFFRIYVESFAEFTRQEDLLI